MPRPRLRAIALLLASVACAPPPTPTATPEPTPEPTPVVATPHPDPEPTPAPTVSELTAMTLPARPDWADKYANPELDERFFDVAKLMATHGLDRAAAVELQNHFRDLTRAQPQGDREAQYAEALGRAKAGQFEDGRDVEQLAKASFIVVFDLDETLYDQSIKLDPEVVAACQDFVAEHDDGPRAVKLTPGWAEAIHRIHALGGAVVLFSANVDARCWANAAKWTLDGVPIVEHPEIAGMLTNSHLVLQPKDAGSPVVEPSKDLRIVDESLTRAIIVDDNPKRLFQYGNTRVFKKFQADTYCVTKDRKAKHADDEGLRRVVDEIEEAVRYQAKHPGTTFVQAYRPYTVLGRVAVGWLSQANRMREDQAIAYLRQHPELVDQDF